MTLARQCLTLFWLQLKMRLGISAMKYYRRHDPKKFRMQIFIIVAIVYGLGAFLAVYGLMYRALVKSALALGLGSLMLAVTILVSMIMVFLFGAFQINAVVFNAKDIEWYACLPLKPQAVFASKFGMVYAYELLVTMFMLIPAYLLYAIETGAGAVFWVTAVLTMPLVPVMPLSLASILALPLTKLSSRFRRRELMTTIFTLVLVGLFVALELVLTRVMRNISGDGASELLSEMLTNAEPVLKLATSAFPPAMWLSSGLTLSSGLSLFLFAGSSVLTFCAAVYLSGRLYYAGTLSILETPKAKSKKAKFRTSSVKVSSAVFAIALADLKTIFKTPVYLVNSLTGAYFAVMLVIMPYMTGSQWGEMRARLIDTIGKASPAMVLVFAVLALTLSGTLNPAASTSLSRAGRSFWIHRTIPVAPRDQITAKLCSALTLSLFSLAAVTVCLGIMLPEIITFLLMAIIPAAAAIVSTTAFSMLPDIIAPKLRWDSEAEAMKQNMNSMWGMLLGLCPALVMLLALPLAFALPDINLTLMLVILMLLAAGLAVGGVLFLRWTADSRFDSLEDRL